MVLLSLAAVWGESPAESEEPHHVTAVRFWSLGKVTRIAIETDGDFHVKSDRLDNPDRLFYDLTGTRPVLSHKSMTVIKVGDKFVKQIRVAEPQRNVTRVVLDLASPVEASISRLDSPERLIIELRAATGSPAVQPPVEIPDAEKPPFNKTTQRIPSEPQEQPAPKPVQQHREFSPPPPIPLPGTPSKRPQEARLEEPPLLRSRSAAPPSSVAALSYSAPPEPYRATGETPLAKPTAPLVTSPLPAPAPKPSGPAVLSASIAPGSIAPGSIADETALPAKRDSSGGRSMIRVLGLKVGRIVLDPGHGGHDTGTIGPNGLEEKDLVLDVAQRLGALIEQRMGSEVIYTRTDDTFVPLERRTEIANEAKADLFLSIHANSSPLRSADGVETYYLNFTTSRTALEVAARENAGSQKNIFELQDLLQKIALKDKVEESREFATRIQSALYSMSARANPRSRDRGVKKAPFVVLIGASMPSVLAEIGFISNAHDENIMRREEYRQRIAEALYKGLSNYAGTLSHFQVAQRH
ncbi:MAG TPA: N-acetylmuramoyl-L-alanine amidase [Bryobacteraceae bacterium]|nr:N-acetylmuramoyl-L-alanine amidase [Bryobacteraceae bacterium]